MKQKIKTFLQDNEEVLYASTMLAVGFACAAWTAALINDMVTGMTINSAGAFTTDDGDRYVYVTKKNGSATLLFDTKPEDTE